MTAALIYGVLAALSFFGLGFLCGNSVGYREAMRDTLDAPGWRKS